MEKIPTQMFKKIIGMCGLLLLVQSAQAQFTFPVYEPFGEYPEGVWIGKNTSSQNPFNNPAVYANWTQANSMSTNNSPLVSVNYALSYLGLAPDPNTPHKGIMGATAAGRSTDAPFTAQTTGTNYLSFLLNIKSLPTLARPIIGMLETASPSSANGSSGVTVWVTPSGQLQFGMHNSATPLTNTTSALSIGNTYFIVLAYVFSNNITKNTGEVDLWVNPTSLGNDANIPAPTISTTNSNPSDGTGGAMTAPPTLQGLCLIYGTGQGGSVISTNLFDEIRVDNHWAGVTPTGPPPGPTYNVTGGGTGCPGDVFAVGLSGSVTTNIYWLYLNSAFSGQTVTGTGSTISFGAKSVSGVYTVVASNTVSGNVGWMSGNAIVSVLAGPSITTEPASALVATNGYATFTVAATGNGLNYQWYKSGTGLSNGGHVSGAQTNMLVISPATTADAATAANGYYVIITNSCGLAATSTPIAALTLDVATNLVWQGGHPNTNWDLATTANWTNSAGIAVVFNEGDNVTFNDSSTNQIVTLVGALAPTSINETASKNYFIIGSGSIAGPGSLLMNGSGTLAISNANSYTGGSTINSGTVVVDDSGQRALGIGPVTLAGGTLEIGAKSGSALVGLSNINVTASSTLQFDGAGSYAFNILNTLTGSLGATLTIYDSSPTPSTTPDRVRLYGYFTNNAPMVITTAGNEVDIAPYNTTNGSQVFNGVISGSGGRFVPRGNGSVTFNNAANTFNDSGVVANGNYASGYSVLLSSGNVGVGADAASWPTSSPLGTGIVGIQVNNEGGEDHLFASGGAHTIANSIAYTSATNTVTLSLSGSNSLTLAGSFTLSGADGTGPTNRTINVQNTTAPSTISGVISDAGLGCGLIKIGAGTLVLSAVNTYTGPTTISNGTLLVNGQIGTNITVAGGTLGGSGTVLGPVTVLSGGTLAPGTSAIGTLTINTNLTLNGNLFFKVHKGLSQSNDIASVSGTLTSSGVGDLTVTNAGPALVIGDTFKLFNKALANGSTLGVSGGGVLWANHLQVDGSISVTSGSVPTPVINSVILQDNGTNFVFSGTNGPVGGGYSVLSSTNLLTPLANWVLQASGTFNGTGGFSYTNVIDVPMRFLLLRIP
jgi:autotransporter-associated beta strand protein